MENFPVSYKERVTMSGKLLASDYDGTLKYKDIVTREDRESLARWQSEGNLFVINTGRSLESILQEAGKNDIHPDYFITNNGGMGFDREKRMLFSSFLDPVMSLDIIYLSHGTEGIVSYVVNDGILRHRIIVNPELTDKRYPFLKPDMSEEELMKLNRYAQFVISMNTEQDAARLAEKINERFPSLVEAYANKYACDIVPRGVSKAEGLDRIRKITGIPLRDTYTIGDADNDIPMMKYTPNGCCMADAPEEIRSQIRHIRRNISDLIENLPEYTDGD